MPDKTASVESPSTRRWLSIILDFGANTTAHGLPRVTRSTSLPNRLYWLFASIFFTGVMIFFIIRAILDYFGYPTQIDISFDPEWPQHYPAFTFCNVGRIRLDLFLPAFLEFTNALNVTNTNDSSKFHDEQYPFIEPFLLQAINSNSMGPLFYSLASMLVSCTYNSRPCSATDFTSFISTEFGNCYTFNAKIKNASNDSIRNGMEFDGVGKLEVGLYMHSDQYFPNLATGIGVVALVHDNAEAPQMETSGLNLIPGRKHKFSFRKKVTTLVSAPYTACSDQIQAWMEPMFINYPSLDAQYSQMLCFKLALQILTYRQCNCTNPYLWDVRSIVLPGTTDVLTPLFCDPTNPCYMTANAMFMDASSNASTSDIQCPEHCSQTEFVVKKSSLLAPTPWQRDQIKAFVENSSVPLPSNWSTASLDYIERNYLLVSIIRETHLVENNIQRASLQIIDVLSNVGGQTGLWLGISLLSIMELFEMFYRLVRYQCTLIRSAVRSE